MAWTAPRTWTDGEDTTATLFNEQIRDNLNALKSPPSDNYECNEGADYTTASTVFADIDATNLALSITPNQTNATIIVGFSGTFAHDGPAGINLEIDIDGSPVGGNDGILRLRPRLTGPSGALVADFMRLITGLSLAVHTIKLQWKTDSGNATLYAGAGTANGCDLHPQFWVREVS